METNLYPYGGAGGLQVLLSLGHQDGLVTREHGAVAVRGRVSFSSHDPSGLHGYRHGLGTVQAVDGVVEPPARTQAQAEAVRRPHPAVRLPPLVVGVLGGLCAALGRDGDEGFGGGARRDWWGGLLVAWCVGDGWKEEKSVFMKCTQRFNVCSRRYLVM